MGKERWKRRNVPHRVEEEAWRRQLKVRHLAGTNTSTICLRGTSVPSPPAEAHPARATGTGPGHESDADWPGSILRRGISIIDKPCQLGTSSRLPKPFKPRCCRRRPLHDFRGTREVTWLCATSARLEATPQPPLLGAAVLSCCPTTKRHARSSYLLPADDQHHEPRDLAIDPDPRHPQVRTQEHRGLDTGTRSHGEQASLSRSRPLPAAR